MSTKLDLESEESVEKTKAIVRFQIDCKLKRLEYLEVTGTRNYISLVELFMRSKRRPLNNQRKKDIRNLMNGQAPIENQSDLELMAEILKWYQDEFMTDPVLPPIESMSAITNPYVTNTDPVPYEDPKDPEGYGKELNRPTT